MKPKNYLLLVFVCSLFLLPETTRAGSFPCMMPGCDNGCGPVDGARGRQITRTYKHLKNSAYKKTVSYKTLEKIGIEINLQDFTNHMAIDNTRSVIILNESVTMDIKTIDETGDTPQTWVLPDFNNYANTKFSIEHLELAATSLTDSFPNPTHTTITKDFVNGDDKYEMYQLNNDELFYYGFGIQEENGTVNDIYGHYRVAAPIPLKWGTEYTGEVIIEYTDDPDIDSIQLKQFYDVVAHGKLKFTDEDDVDAVKAIFTQVELEYKNGALVKKDSIEQLLFYSKKGHFIRADVEDVWNSEGNVELKRMSYQKIDAKTASVNDLALNKVKTFPNPIASGEILTIESKFSLNLFQVDVYNVNGQKISTLQFSEENNNQYQIKIPQELSSGLYFYKVHDKKGNVLKNGKIQIK